MNLREIFSPSLSIEDLKVARFSATEHILNVFKTLSLFCAWLIFWHYLAFSVYLRDAFCQTLQSWQTHKTPEQVEGTVHVPWVIFNKSLSRQFRNSQIHASNAIYPKDANLSHSWCRKFDSCWIMCNWRSSLRFSLRSPCRETATLNPSYRSNMSLKSY